MKTPDMELSPPAAQLVSETWEKLALKTPLRFQYLTLSEFSCAIKNDGRNKSKKSILFILFSLKIIQQYILQQLTTF
jgi:hypothetical protein